MAERDFWKTMNPRRLHALYNAYFEPERARAKSARTEAAQKEPKKGLCAYFMGG